MSDAAETIEKRGKKRKIWLKKGSYKYLLQLLHGIRREIRELRRTQRYMIQGLEHTFLFDKDYIKTIACNDDIDREILDVLYMAGPPGRLPRDIALELAEYKINPWNVTRRIRHMNKRLDHHIAKQVAEKRGIKWALTSWTFHNWGEAGEEITVAASRGNLS